MFTTASLSVPLCVFVIFLIIKQQKQIEDLPKSDCIIQFYFNALQIYEQ